MVVAAATTILFYRLKQPVVLGYILAGLIIGPHTASLVAQGESVAGLADLGIIFLMFAVGLEFNLRKLRKVGMTAAFAAIFQIAAMIAVGYFIGRSFGWNPMDSIFLGAIISISSTTIIVKVLMEMGKLHEEYAEFTLGMLIVEDLAAIVIVGLLQTFGLTGVIDAGAGGLVLAKVAIFALIAIAVGLVLVPRLIDWVSRFHVEEVLVITVVGLAFGAALLAFELGFSLALGAFLIGAIIAESRAVRRVEHKIVPIRDMFTAMFFVAVGMLIDPRVLLDQWKPIVVITGATIVGKIASNAIGAYMVGKSAGVSARSAFSMGNIGEFSFIIAGIGLTIGATSDFLYPIAVAVCALTTFTGPYVMRVGDSLAVLTGERAPAALQRASDAYTRTITRLFHRDGEPTGPRVLKHGTRVVIYGAWLLGVFVLGGYLSLWADEQIGERLALSENLQRAGAVVGLGILVLPLFVAFTKATEAWAHELAKARMFRPRRLARATPNYRRPRFAARLVAGASSFALLALAGRIAWGVHPLALPAPKFLAPALLVVAGVGWVLWRRATKLYLWMEETLDMLLDEVPEETPMQRLRQRYPWGVDVDEVPVLASSWGAFSSLRDLDIRVKTGCTVLNVERGSTVIPNPHPDMALLPGDRVILVGKRDQLDRAAMLLHARGTPTRATDLPAKDLAEEVRVPASSPAVGATLGHIGLREKTGVRIAAFRRERGESVHPESTVRVEAGDHVLLAGSEDALARAKEMLRVRPAFESGRARKI